VTLKVGISAFPYTRSGVDLIVEADRLGADSVWVPEAWGYDALTPLGYLAARTTRIRLGTGIVQLGARSPAMLAMSAMSLQALSEGRLLLGMGTSGPQVMEGWHGVKFTKPVQRTRETIEIVRMIARGERLAHDGEVYKLPLPGGEGRSIRSSARPVQVPIYIAALGPANLALTGQLADGWIGNSFLPESAAVFFDPIRRGAEAAARAFGDLDLTVSVRLEFTDDVEEAARRHASGYAFTFGAMGSPEHNFYLNAFSRQGFGDDVRAVQRLWLEGDRQGARDRVPLDIGLKTNLLGSHDMVTERLRLYRDAGVTTLRVGLSADDVDSQLESLEVLLNLVDSVNAERPASVPAT
jgi:F420-dependent oxidoreductase-like protein